MGVRGASTSVVAKYSQESASAVDFAPRLQVSEMQRSRLLAAAIWSVERHGYADTTVTHITSRARISRRTFYELFDNREDCLAAMFEDALALVHVEITRSATPELSWRERMRAGLWAVLSFFDVHPTIARVCVVQVLQGDERVLERRAEVLARLAEAIDRGREESSVRSIPSLTAEGLVGATHAILYARLLKPQNEPLTGLLNGLMGMIVHPYLGTTAARREQRRARPAPVERSMDDPPAHRTQSNPLEGIAMRVTYRTAQVLKCVADHPGISNRQVGEQAGISDQGQTSKLMSRLERLGLICNSGEGHTRGEPNAWSLTSRGAEITESILVRTLGREAA